MRLIRNFAPILYPCVFFQCLTKTFVFWMFIAESIKMTLVCLWYILYWMHKADAIFYFSSLLWFISLCKRLTQWIFLLLAFWCHRYGYNINRFYTLRNNNRPHAQQPMLCKSFAFFLFFFIIIQETTKDGYTFFSCLLYIRFIMLSQKAVE